MGYDDYLDQQIAEHTGDTQQQCIAEEQERERQEKLTEILDNAFELIELISDEVEPNLVLEFKYHDENLFIEYSGENPKDLKEQVKKYWGLV